MKLINLFKKYRKELTKDNYMEAWEFIDAVTEGKYHNIKIENLLCIAINNMDYFLAGVTSDYNGWNYDTARVALDCVINNYQI